MGYPSEWNGSAESESGMATFKIDGSLFSLRLERFTDYQLLISMLDIAFNQGKIFAATAIKSHLDNAMEQARRDHVL